MNRFTKFLFIVFLIFIIFSFDITNAWVEDPLSKIEKEKIVKVLEKFKEKLDLNYSNKKQIIIYKKIHSSIWNLQYKDQKKIDVINYVSSRLVEEILFLKINEYWKYFLDKEKVLPNDTTYLDIKEDDWYYLWKIYINDDDSYEYKIDKDFKNLEITFEEIMHKNVIKIFENWDKHIYVEEDSWCWWMSIKQEVYDKSFKKLTNYKIDKFSEDIKIWNIVFSPSIIWEAKYSYTTDSENNYKIYENQNWGNIWFDSAKTLEQFLYNKVVKEDKKMYKNYIIQYKDFPWINFFYESKWFDNSAIRVVWLWDEEKYIEDNIKENWAFYDLSITNKIIWYYKDNQSLWVFSKDWAKIMGIINSQLPFFYMKKLDDSWNYLVYLKDWYEMQMFAEMCKPLVYYYSKDKEDNYLNLITKKWDYFTKLIPLFNQDYWWKFTWDNSKIYIDWSEYDYLYYSLVDLWYKHNEDWWIIKWENIVDFFDDKLSKINLNNKEEDDFIDYWKDKYEKDKYYFVSFKYKDELDKIIKLDFEKEIKNEFRLLLDSYEINDFSYEKYEKYLYPNVWDDFDKYLIKTFNRDISDREVLEWWWVLVRNDTTYVK